MSPRLGRTDRRRFRFFRRFFVVEVGPSPPQVGLSPVPVGQSPDLRCCSSVSRSVDSSPGGQLQGGKGVRTMVRGVDGGSVVGVCVWVHVVGGTRGATVISRVSWQGVGACVNTRLTNRRLISILWGL